VVNISYIFQTIISLVLTKFKISKLRKPPTLISMKKLMVGKEVVLYKYNWVWSFLVCGSYVIDKVRKSIKILDKTF